MLMITVKAQIACRWKKTCNKIHNTMVANKIYSQVNVIRQHPEGTLVPECPHVLCDPSCLCEWVGVGSDHSIPCPDGGRSSPGPYHMSYLNIIADKDKEKLDLIVTI